MACSSNSGLSFYTGEDFLQEFDITQCDGVTVQDISGWTLTLSVRLYADSIYPILFTITASITDPTNGKCTTLFPRSETVSLSPRSYSYDLSRTDTGSDSAVIVGFLNLLPRSR